MKVVNSQSKLVDTDLKVKDMKENMGWWVSDWRDPIERLDSCDWKTATVDKRHSTKYVLHLLHHICTYFGFPKLIWVIKGCPGAQGS